jgi:DNA-binding transcriptional ArsR family regulator
MNEARADAVFQALGNAQRRKILDIVRAKPGCTVSEVVKEFDTSRIAVMKHLNVLYEADLLLHEKVGRSRHLYLNVIPIQLIYDRWSDDYAEFWGGKLADLKYRVEGNNAVESQTKARGKKHD